MNIYKYNKSKTYQAFKPKLILTSLLGITILISKSDLNHVEDKLSLVVKCLRISNKGEKCLWRDFIKSLHIKIASNLCTVLLRR